MYDPWGTYMTLEEAIQVGRELEKLNYYWYEHPMPEYRVESYVRLCRELTHPDPLARDRCRRRLLAAPSGSCAAPAT